MTRIVYAVPAALLLSLCLGCNNAKAPDAKEKVEAMSRQLDNTAQAIAADSTVTAVDNEDGQPQNKNNAGTPAGKKPDAAPPAANPDWDKKIVKTADLNLEVNNFGLFTRRLHEAVRLSGGYIAQEEQTQSVTEISNSVTIKVPVANFDDLLMKLPSDSEKLVDKKISSQDVTMEVVDTKSRLETKKEVRERYLELLRQAHTMKDILAVQNEIDDIQGEMDQASGRIAWLGHSAAYSTINLKFYQVLVPGVPQETSPSFFHQLTDSFGEGWKDFSSLLVGLMRLWPLWIGVGFGVYWLRKTMRAAKVKPAVVQPREEAKE